MTKLAPDPRLIALVGALVGALSPSCGESVELDPRTKSIALIHIDDVGGLSGIAAKAPGPVDLSDLAGGSSYLLELAETLEEADLNPGEIPFVEVGGALFPAPLLTSPLELGETATKLPALPQPPERLVALRYRADYSVGLNPCLRSGHCVHDESPFACSTDCAPPTPFEVDPPARPTAPILPTQCPAGFTKRPAGVIHTCDPFPDAECVPGWIRVPGVADCVPIGTDCPPTGFPENAGPGAVFVRPGATGDGSRDSPMGSVEVALGLSRRVALAEGAHLLAAPLAGQLELIGACSRTELVAPTGTVAVVASGDSRIENLTLRGGDTGLVATSNANVKVENVRFVGQTTYSVLVVGSANLSKVEISGGATVAIEVAGGRIQLDRVEVDSGANKGLHVSGPDARADGSGLVVRGARKQGLATNGLRIEGGAHVELDRVVVVDTGTAGVRARDPHTEVILRELVVRQTGRDGAIFGRGVEVSDGAIVRISGAWLERNHEAHLSAVVDARLEVSDAIVVGQEVDTTVAVHLGTAQLTLDRVIISGVASPAIEAGPQSSLEVTDAWLRGVDAGVEAVGGSITLARVLVESPNPLQVVDGSLFASLEDVTLDPASFAILDASRLELRRVYAGKLTTFAGNLLAEDVHLRTSWSGTQRSVTALRARVDGDLSWSSSTPMQAKLRQLAIGAGSLKAGGGTVELEAIEVGGLIPSAGALSIVNGSGAMSRITVRDGGPCALDLLPVQSELIVQDFDVAGQPGTNAGICANERVRFTRGRISGFEKGLSWSGQGDARRSLNETTFDAVDEPVVTP